MKVALDPEQYVGNGREQFCPCTVCMEKGDIFWRTGAISSHILVNSHTSGGIQCSNLSEEKNRYVYISSREDYSFTYS